MSRIYKRLKVCFNVWCKTSYKSWIKAGRHDD